MLADRITLPHFSVSSAMSLPNAMSLTSAQHPNRQFATAGGLISYGLDIADIFRRGASYVDRVFKGENVGALPVEAPTKFELVVNLKTAKALGLELPPTLLARADEVIE